MSRNDLQKEARGGGQHHIDGALAGEAEPGPASGAPGLDGVMSELRAAADAGDEPAFLSALGAVDWAERTSADFLLATRLALRAGAYVAARQISDRGLNRYPEDPELQKFARALAPPRVISGQSSTLEPRSSSAHLTWRKSSGSMLKRLSSATREF